MKNTVFLSLFAVFGISGIQLHAQDSLFLKETLQKWQNAASYTLEVAQAMPLEKFDFIGPYWRKHDLAGWGLSGKAKIQSSVEG